MMERTHYTHCPVCGSADLRAVFKTKDQTVSGELFAIEECGDCSLRFTQDAPAAGAIGDYYKSDSYISHTNTAKGIVNKLYHWVRKRTIVRKRNLVQKHTGLQKGSLLDLGSGVGAFVHEMNTAGWQTTGLEPDADARKIAREQYEVDLSDINSFYQLPEAGFDAISMWHVMEHVHDLHGYVQQLKKILRENGRLCIAVPNYTSLDAAIYQQHWAAYDVPRHLYHFSPQSMERLMEGHGLKVISYLPMWYDSFYISLLSSQYRNGKTNWLAAFINGVRSNLRAVASVKRCSSVIYIIGK